MIQLEPMMDRNKDKNHKLQIKKVNNDPTTHKTHNYSIW